jgi:hypothetical protein
MYVPERLVERWASSRGAGSDEPLHPDLEAHYDGDLVHHPLLIGPYQPGDYHRANRSYLAKRECAERALRDRNWWQYVFTHERPYRVHALLRCRKAGLRGREYWEQLGECWIDSENIRQNRRQWQRLWHVDDDGRKCAMDERARAHLASLPEQIEVYRGCRRRNDAGWSWTTDRDVAEWFACRFPGQRPGYVFTGIVQRSDIWMLSYSDDQSDRASEREIASDRVRVVRIERADPERAKAVIERREAGRKARLAG